MDEFDEELATRTIINYSNDFDSFIDKNFSEDITNDWDSPLCKCGGFIVTIKKDYRFFGKIFKNITFKRCLICEQEHMHYLDWWKMNMVNDGVYHIYKELKK